jgi:ribose-phosphate pyrophosphokinase
LRDAGSLRVMAYATHPVLSGKAVERISNSVLDELVVTDTIPLGSEAAALEKLTVLPVAPLLAEAIRRTHDEASISSLFV